MGQVVKIRTGCQKYLRKYFFFWHNSPPPSGPGPPNSRGA